MASWNEQGEEQLEGRSGATSDQTNADLDARDDPEGFDDDLTAPPRSIGRFVVLRPVGRGSMGEVYSAFDEELGRRVAVKLLRRQPRAHETRRARMRREAQTMAQVSHPNVIQVFEVGDHGERTFIAMEYVEGQTLERWQRGVQGTARSREAILDAYLQAGAGLAAAHRAGVVHRDFKPANVLVDADGRVHVMDFGLAAWLRRSESSATGDPLGTGFDGEGPLDAPDAPRLTRVGALLGTPAFMSPEQYRGEELDGRSDQFSFCVALWEALVGVHPFGGTSVDVLRTAILLGEVREGPAARALPATLRRVLLRGLAKQPQERWPDMDALLAALRPRPRHARWPWVVAGVALVAVAGVSYGVASKRSGLCEGGREPLARVWDDERRAAARAGLVGTGVSLADATWQRVEAQLDAYAEGWVETRQRVCEATHVHGEQSTALMDQRMACLDLRLHALAGLLSTFETADLATVLRAVDAAARLPDVGVCETAGVGALADDEATRPEAAELRRRLVIALAQLDVGRMSDAYVQLDSIRSEALARGLPRLAAEALVHRGRAEVDRGLLEQADATLEAGLWEAVARGHDDAAFKAAVEHVVLVGVTLGEVDRGRTGIVRVEALVQRMGAPEAARVRVLEASGLVLGRHGDYREARSRLDEALALAERVHGPRHVSYAKVLNAAGVLALWGSDLDEAERVFTELVALDRQIYDPMHTNVASALNNLAVVLANKGDHAGAQARFQEVYEVRSAALGEHHVEVADALVNLSGAMMQRGEVEAALPSSERARAIYATTLGEDSAKVDDADVIRGMMLLQLDRDEEAEAILRAVLARQRKRMGERHPDLIHGLRTLGRLLTRPADAAEAVELLRVAIEIQRQRLRAAGTSLEGDAELATLEQNLADAQAMVSGEPVVVRP